MRDYFATAFKETKYNLDKLISEVFEIVNVKLPLDKKVNALSGGQQARLLLAHALIQNPDLLLLDEPSSGLNPEESLDMSFWIEDIRDELGISVLMIDHDMSLISSVCDRVVALNYGRTITVGAPTDVLSHPEVIAAYLGCEP